MKYFINRQALIVLVLTMILAGLSVYGRAINHESHEKILRISHDVAEDDSRLNQNVLMTRLGLVRHYDDLNQDIRQVKEAFVELEAVLLQVYTKMPDNMATQFQTMKDSFEEKSEYLEKFKSANSVLRNSLMYFTLETTRLTGKLQGNESETRLIKDLGMLSIRMMQYYRNPEKESKQLLEEALDVMGSGRLAEKYSTDIKNIVSHGRLVSSQIERTDMYMRRFMDNPVARDLSNIINVYFDYHEAASARSQKSRWLTSIVALLLVFYLIYLFARLRFNANQLFIANNRIAEEKELAEITLGSIADGVITTDSQGNIKYMNPIAEHLTGWQIQDATGLAVMEVFHAVDINSKSLIDDPIRECLATNQIIFNENEYILFSKKGIENIIRLRVAPIRDEDQNVHGAVMVFHDVSETHQLIQHISHQARHDALTGLFNRREFEKQLQEIIRQSEEENIEHAMCFLDLDQFKIVNDTCGHIAGDELLKQLSRLLHDKIRSSDTLARLGGDEFGVLLHSCSLERAIGVADLFREAIQHYRFSWMNNTFDIGVSIGLVPITANSGDMTSIMSKADVACYAAKDLGRNRVHVYMESDLDVQKRHSEMHTAATINKAIEEKRFELHCQLVRPIKNTVSNIEHYEMLVRMITEDGELLPPGSFIPAAERYNLMTAIDKWVIQESFEILEQLNNSPLRSNLTHEFSINLSGTSIGDVGLKSYILDMVDKYHIQPGWVCFEITETSAVANLNSAMDLIADLKQQGFRFSLDDFGTGMSSFTYLKTLKVDFLKIDGSFVLDIADDPVDYAMVESINHIGHVMGMATIAEFVESEAILDQLQILGVDYVQGYAIEVPKRACLLLESFQINSEVS